MQQDNNNIENKLRQLDSQQLPDLSHMDEHWQQMQAMLQPPSSGMKVNAKGKLLGGGIAGVAIITLCFLAYQKFAPVTKKAKQTNYVENNVNAANAVDTPSITDSAVKPVTLTAGNSMLGAYTKLFVLPPVPNLHDDTNVGNGGEDIFIDSVNEITAPQKILDQSTLLTQFIGQLSKSPQQFFINNKRDTLITASEGTSILIPANSFGGADSIELRLIEYYKKSDMILNQLSTTSNGNQLETGGMINITATHNGKEVKVAGNKPLTLFMPDTSHINMTNMELFNGDKKQQSINWLPRGQSFVRNQWVTEVRVLNIVDEPYHVRVKNKGEIGYFLLGDSLKMTRSELKRIVKAKYGYHKVKLRPNFREAFFTTQTDRYYDETFARRIGDSVWMDKTIADRYKLVGTATRQTLRQEFRRSNTFTNLNLQTSNAVQNIRDKYNVDITELKWINCDRYYADSRKKIEYNVDLGDTSINYYTVLVFDKINSIMTGNCSGNKVSFPNIPVGEPVKIISMGINQSGETVYSIISVVTGEAGVTGLQFEKTSTIDLKTSLCKLDQ
ncbi:hypothetical protein ACQ33O_00985 [Ferruginibacter sp. SUN002]|uniref:hypothetical protein n=1 Tax=Ferruginibacter sp. SUN002 TaxID=2937789 RepID=UPI003D367079